MSENTTTNAEEDIAVKRLRDTDLWIKIKVPRSVKVSNIEMAQAVFDSATADTPDAISPSDILGAQYQSDESAWFINVATKKAKALVMGNAYVSVKGTSCAIYDYSIMHDIPQKRGIRLSIHELPQTLSDEYIEQWIDTWAKRETRVARHKEGERKRKEHNDMTNRFQHLYTGHRVCYVSEIYDHKPRYSNMEIPDPRDEKHLVDTRVVLFYNGQPPVNCRICYENHSPMECPEKPQPKCFLCNQPGHTKHSCPSADIGPTCFSCNKRGHTKRNCNQLKINPHITTDPKTQKQPEATPQGQDDRHIEGPSSPSTPANHAPQIHMLHELLDKCLDPKASGPSSPELLKRVENLLMSANQTKEIQEQSDPEYESETNDQAEAAQETVKAGNAKATIKQSDIRAHLGAIPKTNQNGSNGKKKKKAKRDKKRKMSSPPTQNKDSKKGRSNTPTSYESPTVSEYESLRSSDEIETSYHENLT